jgi:polysaccharide deacetylase family protein (PEP-CTERM system associated)
MNDSQIHLLTIDVEDWPQSTLDTSLPITGRVVKNTRRILRILKYFDVRATFFVLGLVAERYPTLVKEIHREGHEIATHGYSHQPVFQMSPKGFKDDLYVSIEILEQLIGEKIKGYRAPDFSITVDAVWAFDIIASQGLKYDSSIFPVWNPRYGFPGTPRFPYRLPNGLIEFPLSTLRTGSMNWPVAGGGYFRLFPLLITYWAILRIQAENQRAVIYLHPYELDPYEFDELEWDVPFRLRMTQSINRRYTVPKLAQLLKSFCFCPVIDVLNQPKLEEEFRSIALPMLQSTG